MTGFVDPAKGRSMEQRAIVNELKKSMRPPRHLLSVFAHGKPVEGSSRKWKSAKNLSFWWIRYGYRDLHDLKSTTNPHERIMGLGLKEKGVWLLS